MKKLLMQIILMFTVFSCGMAPEKKVENFLNEVKKREITKAMSYANNPEIVKNLKYEYKNEMQKQFFDTLYNNLKFEVLNSSKQEDKSIIVNVSIENVDVQEIFLMVFQESLKKAFLGDGKINIEAEMLSLLKSKNLPKKKIVDQYVLVKKSGKYKIEVTNKNIDNIFGGYFSSLSNVSNLGR